MTFSIDIHQDTLVKKLKPAVVKVYDYYEPGKNICLIQAATIQSGHRHKLSGFMIGL